MTSQHASTPVVALDGDPCLIGGQLGRTQLLFALVLRGANATMLASGPDVPTVAGALTWTTAPEGEGAKVQDTHVREDRAHRGIGRALRDAAQEVVGVRTWSGAVIPDSSSENTWLESASATAGQHPVPVIDIPADDLAFAAAVVSEVYVVLHREGKAVIVALAADTLVWVGHLAWTIDRPGGRLDGDQAGLPVGEVQRVDTRAGSERRGVAGRMYHTAQQVAVEQGWPAAIDHSPDRTAAGDAWAVKVGGWRPELTNGTHMNDADTLQRMLRGLARE